MARQVAFFISPHGFGHAARACAIMEALHGLNPDVEFQIFGRTPPYFFNESLAAPFLYHDATSDVGLVQETPFVEDLPATVRRLDAFLPCPAAVLEPLVRKLCDVNCELVACDISPLGLVAAKAAAIPSVLIENFTWDWIYEDYRRAEPQLQRHIEFLREIALTATYHVQCEPVCEPAPRADLVVPPVSRRPRVSAEETRLRLGIPRDTKMVLLSMGGIPGRHTPIEGFADLSGWRFVIPGGAMTRTGRGNSLFLPHHSEFYHPELVGACDVLVGKAGYSTVAEAYHAGVPFGYVSRPLFRESATMAAFIEREMSGLEIPREEYESGSWQGRLAELAAMPRRPPSLANGADAAGAFIQNLLG